MKDNSRPVYSSEHGRLCPACTRPVASCTCSKQKKTASGDGIVRIRRESKGRGGKTVTVITGIPLDVEKLKVLSGELKRRCGSGGAVKEGDIEVQGDHVDTLTAELQKRGYTVRRSGG